VAAASLHAAAPADAAKRMEILLQDDGIFLYDKGQYERDTAFQVARQLGVTGLRINVHWWMTMPESQYRSTVKPAFVNYDWRIWDEAIARARAFGMRVQLALIGDPPAWACGNRLQPYDCDGYKPDIFEFRAFAQAAAAHFGSSVARYSIWNEPNWYTWLSPHKQAPLLYRALYQQGYEGVKAGNPAAKVLLGELAPLFRENGLSMAPLKFIRKMVCVNKRFKLSRRAAEKCTGGPLKLDGVAHHPYYFEVRPGKRSENPDDVTIASLDSLNSHLDRLRDLGVIDPSRRRTPVYLTEHGYMVTGNPDIRPARRIPESRRQRWVVKAFDIAQKTPRIKSMLYFNLVSPPLGSADSYFDLGLIQSDGVPRGSFFALRDWAQAAIADGRVKAPGFCAAC
jgi:hypothetical protein